ncbi:hypothetical protein GXW77_18965 [Roseomonas alkaliterrae]|uniref:Uncharacterized protein n=1 Tax=Neoroseomonas alkaliterrae TaxID=1452450 RepID=A0A840XRL7_9PROT|nr:hypothetical protein [Neoroseomonas alkaliterrae]MBB5689570.1 hypothetical protein [Neoroseomonas alkaliterrae]MBR0678258.1 hypothetical protein [Neoroseomonas alkaliterrae]
MTTAPAWRRRVVQDMLFPVAGSGWHAPELHGVQGWRWSGPGRLSILRLSIPPGPGRAEAQIVLDAHEALPPVAIFLDGRPLDIAARRVGDVALLRCGWDGGARRAAPQAEFWFLCDRMRDLPAPGRGMRRVGFRLSCLSVEAAADGPPPGEHGLALIAGRRLLAARLAAEPGQARLAFRTEGAARLLEMRLEGARLGADPQPALLARLRAGSEDEMRLSLGPADGASRLEGGLAPAGGLVLSPLPDPHGAALVARLLAALPRAYANWLDAALAGAAPDADLLAFWKRALDRLALAAEAALAVHLAENDELFAAPSRAFAWPAG